MSLRTLCLWPGLPAAWVLGLARGLLVALFFAWSLCLLLLATFVWPEWVSSGLLRFLWLAASCIWFAATVRNYLCLSDLLEATDARSAEEFVEAQAEYLRGNWFEAEAILLEVLQRHPRDAEAMLLLIGVLRHTKRWQPALRRLGQLELLEAAAPWKYEIERERRLIQRAVAEESASHAGQAAIDGTEPNGERATAAA